MIRYLLLILSPFLFISCGTESTPVYTLEIEPESIQGGTVEQSGSEASEGEKITLTAVPEEHFVFVRWGGDYTGTENPLEVIMEKDMVIFPIFEKIEYPVAIDIQGEGTVQEEVIQEKTLDLTHATRFKLTATPADGWEFVEWGGDASGERDEIELTVDGEMNITALFQRIDYTVNITIEGEGRVEKEVIQSKSSEEFPFETKLQLTATPESGWEFVEWSGDAFGSENVIEIDVNQEKNIIARFEKNAENFTGTWINVDPDIRGITRVVIRNDSETIFVKMWGSCHPTDCNWGVETTNIDDANDNQLSIKWNQGFVIRNQVISYMNDGRLKIDTHSHFIDNSGRPDYDSTNYFVKD